MSKPISEYSDQELLSSLSDEELKSIAGISSPEQPKDNLLPKLSETESLITNRPNNIKSLIKDPTTLDRFIKHPLGTSLRTVGGALDYLEGVPASIAIDLQKGKPKDILNNLGKVATGERVPQRGDLLRNLGVGELTSSTIGLLSGGAKLSPDTALGKVIFENKAINGLTNAVSKVGVDGLSKIMSVVGDVPQKDILSALNNPNFLSKSWLNKSEKIVQKKYEDVVKPLINDNTKRVNTSSLKNVVEDLGILQKNGDFTKAFDSMKAGEKRNFLNWEKKINQNNLSFNDVDSLIGQMDSALDATYKMKRAGKEIDYSKDFVRNTTQLRNKLNAVRKSQYPDAGAVLDEYALIKTGQNVYKNFDRWLPHWMPAITANAGAAVLGGFHNPQFFGAATLTAIPKLQATGIRLGAQTAITEGGLGKYLSSGGIKAQGINRLLDGSKR